LYRVQCDQEVVSNSLVPAELFDEVVELNLILKSEDVREFQTPIVCRAIEYGGWEVVI
jgi:hypothetical protein